MVSSRKYLFWWADTRLEMSQGLLENILRFKCNDADWNRGHWLGILVAIPSTSQHENETRNANVTQHVNTVRNRRLKLELLSGLQKC